MIDFRIEIGDCRDTLRRLASEGIRVQTCVTLFSSANDNALGRVTEVAA